MNYIVRYGMRLEDPLHPLLKKLLQTQDPAEFEKLSFQLRSLLHERIETLRKEAHALKSKIKQPERRKRPRND